MKNLCAAQFNYKCLDRAEVTSGELYGKAICCKTEREAQDLIFEIEKVISKRLSCDEDSLKKIIITNIGVWSFHFPKEDQDRILPLFHLKEPSISRYGQKNDIRKSHSRI